MRLFVANFELCEEDVRQPRSKLCKSFAFILRQQLAVVVALQNGILRKLKPPLHLALKPDIRANS